MKTSVLMVDGRYHMVTLDYCMYPSDEDEEEEVTTPIKRKKPVADDSSVDPRYISCGSSFIIS